jgi:hypothetical protein
MGNWFVKSFDNYFKFIDEESSMIVLTSGSVDDSGSVHNVISYNFLSESVPKYEGIRDSFISSSFFTSSYTGSSEPVPQIISESLWEEKKTELKSYIINNI